MYKTFGYYENWKGEPLACPKCQWQGTSQTASEDDLSNGQGFCCPRCKELVQLLVVMFPTRKEQRAHWDQLSESEQQSLVAREAFLSKYEARKLKSPDQLPDVDLPIFVVKWDEQEMDGGVNVVLSVESRAIHTEPRTWESANHFREVAKILRERYGNRVADLVPTPRSEMYLYGDGTWTLDLVARVRAALRSKAVK